MCSLCIYIPCRLSLEGPYPKDPTLYKKGCFNRALGSLCLCIYIYIYIYMGMGKHKPVKGSCHVRQSGLRSARPLLDFHFFIRYGVLTDTCARSPDTCALAGQVSGHLRQVFRTPAPGLQTPAPGLPDTCARSMDTCALVGKQGVLTDTCAPFFSK